MTKTFIHPSAEVAPEATIGEGTRIWHNGQILSGAHIGKNCSFGKSHFIDAGVRIGDNVKVQNYVTIIRGVTIEDGVFIGPYVVFLNDLNPRAINPDGSPKGAGADDWVLTPTLVRYGAALGGNTILIPGVTVGRWAMTGSGAVVTKDVPDYGLVVGNPARLLGYVCPCGHRLDITGPAQTTCLHCGMETTIEE